MSTRTCRGKCSCPEMPSTEIIQKMKGPCVMMGSSPPSIYEGSIACSLVNFCRSRAIIVSAHALQ